MDICFYFSPDLAGKKKGSRGHNGSQAAVIWGCQAGRVHKELQICAGMNGGQDKAYIRKYKISNEQNTLISYMYQRLLVTNLADSSTKQFTERLEKHLRIEGKAEELARPRGIEGTADNLSSISFGQERAWYFDRQSPVCVQRERGIPVGEPVLCLMKVRT